MLTWAAIREVQKTLKEIGLEPVSGNWDDISRPQLQTLLMHLCKVGGTELWATNDGNGQKCIHAKEPNCHDMFDNAFYDKYVSAVRPESFPEIPDRDYRRVFVVVEP